MEQLLQGKMFVSRAFFTSATGAFFDDDAPFVGAELNEKMCWKSSFTDGSGTLDVKVWDEPCRQVFDAAPKDVRALWEKGVEDEDAREACLHRLNRNMAKEYVAFCSLSVWTFGQKELRHETQVNVNHVEPVQAA